MRSEGVPAARVEMAARTPPDRTRRPGWSERPSRSACSDSGSDAKASTVGSGGVRGCGPSSRGAGSTGAESARGGTGTAASPGDPGRYGSTSGSGPGAGDPSGVEGPRSGAATVAGSSPIGSGAAAITVAPPESAAGSGTLRRGRRPGPAGSSSGPPGPAFGASCGSSTVATSGPGGRMAVQARRWCPSADIRCACRCRRARLRRTGARPRSQGGPPAGQKLSTRPHTTVHQCR